MRPILALVPLALAACNINSDANNEQVTLEYNKQQIRDTAVKARDTAKNLARGKPLPPGLSREPVPAPVLTTLPRVDGHEWVRIGTELVLVGVASLVIAQVIQGVFS